MSVGRFREPIEHQVFGYFTRVHWTTGGTVPVSQHPRYRVDLNTRCVSRTSRKHALFFGRSEQGVGLNTIGVPLALAILQMLMAITILDIVSRRSPERVDIRRYRRVRLNNNLEASPSCL